MKDIWIDLYEEFFEEAVEKGMDGVAADEYAADKAEAHMADRLGDMADHAMMQRELDAERNWN